MKFFKYLWCAVLLFLATTATAEETTMDRATKADKIFSELFASKRTPSPTDPFLSAI